MRPNQNLNRSMIKGVSSFGHSTDSTLSPSVNTSFASRTGIFSPGRKPSIKRRPKTDKEKIFKLWLKINPNLPRRLKV